MAKRFTATEKWDKVWFRKLKPEHKCFWIYVTDRCNHAGIWEVDFELAGMYIGIHINEPEIKEIFKKQYQELNNGSRWFIRDFIDFQYNGELNPANKVHFSIINILKKEGAYKGLTRGLQAPKDMDMDKATDKDKAKDTEKEVIADLNFVLGTSYKDTSVKTRELISARLNEGFKVEDFKIVHRKMLRTWGADEKMVKYLRPITLYGPKFESYFNMKETTTKLTETGVKAYLIGQVWLKKEAEDVK